MVGHTHQDFLPRSVATSSAFISDINIDLPAIKDFREAPGLFDFPQGYYRKVNLSYLDEKIDTLQDWQRFTKSLRGIDRLYLVNDRHVCNPIMSAYAEEQNCRYLSKLEEDGIPAIIVQCQSIRARDPMPIPNR